MADQSTDLSTTNQPAGTTSIDNGIAYDVAGKPLGPANTGAAESAPPPPPGAVPVTQAGGQAPPPPPGAVPVTSEPPPPPGAVPVAEPAAATPHGPFTALGNNLGKMWDWLNEGIISKDTMVRAMTGMTSDQLNQGLQAYESESPTHAGLREFTRGTLQDIGALGSGLTSPLSVATIGGGEVIASAGATSRAVAAVRAVKTAETIADASEATLNAARAEVINATANANRAHQTAAAAEDALRAGKGTEAAAIEAQRLATESAERVTKAQQSVKAAQTSRATSEVELSRAQRASDAAAKATKAAPVLGNLPELPGAVTKAGRVGTTAAGVGFTGQNLYEAAQPQKEGETSEDALNRRLQALGFAFLGADALKGSKVDIPVGEVPGKVGEFAKGAVTKAIDSVMSLTGKTNDFTTAINRINPAGKKQYADHIAKIENVKDDLQQILRESPGASEDPESFANQITEHIQNNIEKPLQEKAGATRESNKPVVDNIGRRISDGLDKFFSDNKGLYGDETQVMEAKKKLLETILQSRGGQHLLEPNLFEAENIRRRLNRESKPQYATNATPTTDAYKAGASEVASELRAGIDEAYTAAGVDKVAESRSKEADLIDVRDKIRDGQKKAEEMGEPSLWKTVVKKYGIPTLILGMGSLAHPAGWAGEAAFIAGAHAHERATSPQFSLNTAADLARRNPNATATVPEHTPGYTPPTTPAPAPLAGPNHPLTNSGVHADLASHYGYQLDNSPYTFDELNQFLQKDVETLRAHNALKGTPEDALNTKLNAAKAAQFKQNAAAAQKATDKAVADASKKKADDIEAAKTGTKKTDVNPELDRLGRGDESGLVTHTIARKAHSPVMEISGLSEDTSTIDALTHEFAHHAMDAAEGDANGVEIRSDKHPKIGEGAAAASVFKVPSVLDESGSGAVDPDKLNAELAKKVSQKMAGPASREIFKGDTKEEAMAHPSTKNDMSTAKEAVLAVHPDWSGPQVADYLDAGYERARDFLSQPHIAERIQANAAVREDGLPDTLHASRERISNFQREITEAHNEHQGTTNAGPDSGGPGKGSKGGKKPAAEAGKKKNVGGDTGRGGQEPRTGNEADEHAGGGTGIAESQSVKNGRAMGIALADMKMGKDPGIVAGQIQMPEDGPFAGRTLGQILQNIPEGSTVLRTRVMEELDKGFQKYKDGKNAKAAGGTGLEESAVAKKIPVPKETTTGKPEVDEAIRAGGGIPGGIQKGFEYQDKATGETRQYPDTAYVHEPTTGTSLNFPVESITPELVKERLAAKRAEYAAAEKGKVEESNIDKSKPISDRLIEKYGASRDPLGDGFILNDGRRASFGATDHTAAVRSVLDKSEMDPNAGKQMNDFLNDEKAIRTRYRDTRGGKEVVFSVPKDGVSEEQISQMRQAVGKMGHTGNVVMETAEGYGKSAKKEFAHASDIEPMLREIGAHPEQKAAPESQIDVHEKTGGSTFTPEGKNLAGSDLHAVAPYPGRSQVVDKLTPENLAAYKAKNADLLSDGEHAVGTWKDPESGKTYLDISKTIADREEAIKAGQNANQKAIYNLKTGETIPTGGTGEALKPEAVEQSQIAKDRVSTRQPAGKDSTENPLVGAPLEIGRDTIAKAPEKLQAKFAGTVRNYPGVKIPDSIKSPAKVMDKFVNHVKDNLKFLYNQVDPAKRAQTGKWYESANKLAKGMAADNNITEPQAAATIATQSPQKDWDMNVSLARRITDINSKQQDTVTTPEMIQKGRDIVKNTGANEDLGKVIDYLQGKKLSDLKGESGAEKYDRAAWIRLYDEAHNPRDFHSIDPGTGENGELRTNANGAPSKIAWGSLPQIENALSVLEDGSRENISDKLGAQHKVRNFYNNIIDPTNPNDVTIDTHAVAAGLMQPLSGNSEEVMHNFGGAGKHTGTGISGTYPLYADAYRQAASELGIKARELQSIVWEHVREMFPADWKSPENQKLVKDVWQKYSDGKQTLDNTRQQILKISEGAKKQIADARAEAQAKAAAKETKAKKPVDKQTEMVYSGGMSGLGGK
jgi:hypothetical protein